MTNMPLYITVTLALIGGAVLARHHRRLRPMLGRLAPGRLALALGGGLPIHRHDERGESNISTQLGLTVLGIVLLVAIFAALTGVANQVISFIQQQLGLS
jgi:hypothetical protein